MTLNPAAGPCQRWTGGRQTWQLPAAARFDPGRYCAGPVGEATAKAFVVGNHYSGTWPATRMRFGLTDQATGRLVGVAALSVPASAAVLTGAFPGLEPYVESLDLGRFVLADSVPANGESWFLGRVFRLAAAAGIRGLTSFSDPMPRRTAAGHVVFGGHIGRIYQATNATWTGRTRPRSIRLLPDGTTLPDRALSKVRARERGWEHVVRRLVTAGAHPPDPTGPGPGWLTEALNDAAVRAVRHPGQHRYCFRIGAPAERRRIVLGHAAGPYPKTLDVGTAA